MTVFKFEQFVVAVVVVWASKRGSFGGVVCATTAVGGLSGRAHFPIYQSELLAFKVLRIDC